MLVVVGWVSGERVGRRSGSHFLMRQQGFENILVIMSALVLTDE